MVRPAFTFLFALVCCTGTGAAIAQSPGSADQGWTVPPSFTQTQSFLWTTLALQPDGRLLAAGESLAADGSFSITRFHPSGAVDQSFGTAGTTSVQVGLVSNVEHVALDAEGRIYVVGTYEAIIETRWGSTERGFAIVRLLPDGSLDTTYKDSPLAQQGTGVTRLPLHVMPRGTYLGGWARAQYIFSSLPMTVDDIAFQPSGELLLLMHGREQQVTAADTIAVVRFETNGLLDMDFAGLDQYALQRLPGLGAPGALAVMDDGSILIAGKDLRNDPTLTKDAFVIKLDAHGVIDTSFGLNGRATVAAPDVFTGYTADEIALQHDGRIVVGGTRANIGTAAEETMLFRLLPGGALDASFGSGGFTFANLAPNQERLVELALEPNGRILVAGTGNAVSVDTEPFLARFSRDGQLDAGFAVTGIDRVRDKAMDLAVDTAAYLLTYQTGHITSGDRNASAIRKFVTLEPTLAPAVTIIGGDGSSADSDDVAGEFVDFTGFAADADGVVVQTTWHVNGRKSGSGTSATLLLGDGANDVSFTAIDDDGAETSVTVSYEVGAPAAPLPRVGAYTNGIDFYSQQYIATASEFSIAIRNTAGELINTASTADVIEVSGHIFPDANDVNVFADLFVAGKTPAEYGWYMRNENGAFVPWSSVMLAELVPAYANVELQARVDVPMLRGRITAPGTYKLYLGYLRTDGGGVIYIATAATILITP